MRQFLSIASVLTCIVSASACYGQINSPWRFWDVSDGFDESYSNGVASASNGRVWVKHGAVHHMDLINGYSGHTYPDPGGIGKIESAPDGTAWIWTLDQLRRFTDNHWSGYNVDAVTGLGILRTDNLEHWIFTSRTSDFYQSALLLIPLDRNRVLIMLPDRILEFDAATAQARLALELAQTSLTRFTGFRAASGGSIYLSGRGGVGRIQRGISGVWRWEALPSPPSPYIDFEEPMESPSGGVLLTGVTAQSDAAALQFDGSRWLELYKGITRTVRAWPGSAGAVWVQDGNHVIELAAGHRQVTERSGTLSGILFAVMPESAGQFWVTTSQGVAHYMPPLWRTPPEAPPIEDVVNAIAEDRSGKLWFLAAHQLICLDKTTWSSYQLPKGMTAWAVYTDGLGILGDGSVVMRTTGSNLLIFDPGLKKFHTVQHPQGRRTRVFAAQPNGTLIVETFALDSVEDSDFEVFDGHIFKHYLKPPKGWRSADLRTFQVGPHGELWAAGPGFLSVLRGSKLQSYDAKNGFTEPGAFYVHQDRSSQVTAGARDGLYRLEGDRWRRIHAGLDRVRNIITARDGTLWIASGTGIHRYKNDIWISNGEEEGLPSSVAYKVFEDSRGRIWAGTTRGISLFHPDADIDPPMPILTASQNQHEAPPSGRIRVVFSGVDKWKFTLPSRLLFSYRLDGGAWTVFAPVNSASLDKLPAGKHRFEVRAMDRNGNVGTVLAVHDFSVLLPWFMTPGFLWSALASVSTIVVLLSLAGNSYSQRGRLIQELNQKGQLERDSQTILQMIAGREPLPLILQRIAALAAGEAGAVSIVFRDDGTTLDYYPSPAMPQELRAPVERLASGLWWAELTELLCQPDDGSCLLVPVRSGERELLGAVALFRKGLNKLADAGKWLETFSDLAAAAMENARLYERLEHQAAHDALTGLPNRFYFEDRLQTAVITARAREDRMALLYIDLDRFKHINDTLGHRGGDLFLTLVSARLSSVLKAGQTLCRIGGDEFTVLVDRGADKVCMEELAANMLTALRTPMVVEGQRLSASASIGIALFPEHGETPSTLQKHADAAMYRAKGAGRNRMEVFSAELLSSTVAAINLEQLLHRALDESLFELYYQPQFTITGEVAGFEALLRMRDTNGDFVSPAEFIPIAEETGLILPIGAWVLRTACGQIREWLDEGLKPLKIAINVSALQIARGSFADEVASALAEMRIDPMLLELELTESAIMSNLTESRRQMEKLRALGVGMAVDDFGTGYSSLSYLQNLPINVLKIDRSFIHAITGPTGGLPMVQAILALARNLGLTVVAEGVETESQLTALRDSRCDFLQGFFFSKPQPAAALRSYLVDANPNANPRREVEVHELEYATAI